MGLADDRKPVNLMTVHVSKSVTVHEVSNNLQQETICRYNDKIKKNALMCREDVEQFLPEIIGDQKMYSWTDMVGCCMAVNQKTIQNIVQAN